MCGLVGFIGESKNPELSRRFTTNLFSKTECRGVDASGFYCLSSFKNSDVFYHKKPIKSSIYVNENEYKSLWDNSLNLGIFHCRAASQGVGIPIINENNHPFVSKDFKKALMHNGLIDKTEYNLLKSFYQATTCCDSEILLRVLEIEEDIFEKLSIVFENTEDSAFAVAYTENDIDIRNLFLFRNEQRPLYIINLIEELGQVYFFSTVEILFAVLSELGNPFKNLRIHELQPYHVCKISLDLTNEISLQQHHVKIDKNIEKQQLVSKVCESKGKSWVNKINSNEFSTTGAIEELSNKIIDNILKIQNHYKKQNKISPEDFEKINFLFNLYKDTNKKLDSIIRTTLS